MGIDFIVRLLISIFSYFLAVVCYNFIAKKIMLWKLSKYKDKQSEQLGDELEEFFKDFKGE